MSGLFLAQERGNLRGAGARLFGAPLCPRRLLTLGVESLRASRAARYCRPRARRARRTSPARRPRGPFAHPLAQASLALPLVALSPSLPLLHFFPSTLSFFFITTITHHPPSPRLANAHRLRSAGSPHTPSRSVLLLRSGFPYHSFYGPATVLWPLFHTLL